MQNHFRANLNELKVGLKSKLYLVEKEKKKNVVPNPMNSYS